MNHFQQDKPSFFAIIKGNINQMKVPQKIVVNLGEELRKNESIILIGSSGEKWQVSIMKNENDMYLQNIGWEKFMKDNSVKNYEVLCFTYNGENRFKVQIFGKNGLERPSFKKAEVTAEAPTTVKRKRGRAGLKKEEEVAAEDQSAVKKKRGRPSLKKEEKVAAEATSVVKRKRGRPRKNPAAETVSGNKEKGKEEAAATLVAKKEKEKEGQETIVARRKIDEPGKSLAAKRVSVKNEKEEAVEKTMETKRNKGGPRKSAPAPPPPPAVIIIID
ncbi:B3 domain-containing protein At5g18000-like [Vicia villosa]|uniref:B3 domain-containing protein At5g18000-like n=1 Tax=Vicia villosa TaxID=3911 RepID=UPI00273B0EAD|nr:B3 domain-containing protein At5g18000-like [Vicia villosa]